jgi:hypothetical protein
MGTAERLLVVVLRAVGLVACVAIVPTAMPLGWMAVVHEHLGLGRLPDGAIVEYLARSLSGMYAFHGGLFLLASADVRRYAPIVTYAGAAALVGGVGLLALDLSLHMPWWWTAGEGPFVTLLGLVILVLQQRVSASSDRSPAKRL